MIVHRTVLAMICAVMLGDYLTLQLGFPRVIKFIPEILSLATALFVIGAGVRNRFRLVAGKYWIVFGVIVYVMFCGVLINQAGTGPTFAGLRSYFRAIPFFFLPAVFNFTDEQIKSQLKLLLFLAFVQVPFAAYQRWIVFSEGRWTGDDVFGTLNISSILTVFLVSTVLVVVGMFVRNRIGKIAAVLMCFVLLIPTMINETKATVVLLPLGLFVVLSLGVQRGQRLRAATVSLALLVGFGAILVPVYDFFMKPSGFDTSLVKIFTEKDEFDRYIKVEGAGLGTRKEEGAGRADSLRITTDYMSQEPVKLMFGLGLGSVSLSALGPDFTGPYYQLFEYTALMSFSVFLLEIGLLGTAAIFWVYWLQFRDAVAVARHDKQLIGALALGWAGVVVVFALATFYKSIHAVVSLSYLYWYFTGLVAAKRIQLAGERVSFGDRKMPEYTRAAH